jgi:hypothetical protein
MLTGIAPLGAGSSTSGHRELRQVNSTELTCPFLSKNEVLWDGATLYDQLQMIEKLAPQTLEIARTERSCWASWERCQQSDCALKRARQNAANSIVNTRGTASKREVSMQESHVCDNHVLGNTAVAEALEHGKDVAVERPLDCNVNVLRVLPCRVETDDVVVVQLTVHSDLSCHLVPGPQRLVSINLNMNHQMLQASKRG